MNRRHRKRCAVLSNRDLTTLIGELTPQVREAVSLLASAEQELKDRRRAHGAGPVVVVDEPDSP